MEIWKKIEGFEYEVSSYGRVKSLKRKVWNGHVWHDLPEKILKNRGKDTHYKYVTLCDNGRYKKEYVHRLVAFAFLNEPKETVNHIDGDRSNNYLTNLEWASYSENIKHAFNNGLNLPYDRNGKNNPNYKHGKRVKV